MYFILIVIQLRVDLITLFFATVNFINIRNDYNTKLYLFLNAQI